VTRDLDRFHSAQERLVAGLAPGVEVRWDSGPPRADVQARRIILPRIERDLGGEAFMLLRGFVDHEVAHCLYTHPDVGADLSPSRFALLNAVEDGRVNRLIGERFPGARLNIRRAQDALLEEVGDVGTPTPHQEAMMALVLMAEGEEESRALERAHCGREAAALLEEIRDLTDGIDRLTSTAHALRVSDAIHRRWGVKLASRADRSSDQKVLEEVLDGPAGEGLGKRLAKRVESAASAARKAREKTGGVPYVARTELDEVRRVPTGPHPMTSTLFASAREAARPLARRLHLDLAGRSPVWHPHRRRGRLDPMRLARSALSDDRLFRARHLDERLDAALTMLVDFSGSMSRGRLQTALELAMAFSEACDLVGVPNEVLGFTSLPSPHVERCVECKERNPPREEWGRVVRWVPLLHLILKEHDEPFSAVRHAFANALTGTNLRENLDGEAVRWATRRLLRRTEADRTLIVLSDGLPEGASFYKGHGKALEQDLLRAVEDAGRAGVRCIGIGIQTEAARRFYEESVVVNGLEDLVREGYGVVSRVLRGG